MTFSGALKLTDLNDFITPSQVCVKPVTESDSKEPTLGALTEILVDTSGSYYEVASNNLNIPTSTNKLEPAQVNLTDCLACSGCITSAESVLINLQSHSEVLHFISNNSVTSDDYKIPVVSIAPQSLASIAASLSSTSASQVSQKQILRRLRNFFIESMGFADVFDTTFARELALNDHAREFIERRDQATSGVKQRLPMLASSCPGWLCYAEKTHAELLPFIATTKSPQQVMGTLVKNWIADKYHLKPNDIYHITVMPCYDKKLEASRSDFYQDIYSTRDVDCVITTGELQLLLQEKGWDISTAVPSELDTGSLSLRQNPILSEDGSKWTCDLRLPELLHHSGSSSGSYLQSIISQLQKDQPDTQLTEKTMRNADYVEYTLKRIDSGEIIFKGARCYGFRNLQNVVRKIGKEQGLHVATGAAGKLGGTKGAGFIRRRKNAQGEYAPENDRSYDYVEVMACPGGCVNGGGQLKPPLGSHDLNVAGLVEPRDNLDKPRLDDARWGDKEWTKVVEEAYWVGSSSTMADEWSQIASLETSILDDFESKNSSRYSFLRTQYHAVEMEVNGLTVQW